jgi:hypothetical protein
MSAAPQTPFEVSAGDKRIRTFPMDQAMHETIDLPKIYIFNVGPEAWKGVGGGKEWTIPACKEGQRYSEPVAVPLFVLSERNNADVGGTMSTVNDPALSGTLKVGGKEMHRMGVVDDIIGTHSSSAELSMWTTCGKWKGVFWSESEEPTEEEVEQARGNLREYMLLIYSEGKQRIEQKMDEHPNATVRIQERRKFNQAAKILGYAPLYGEGELRLARCPECKEQINEGANYCKHCQQDISPTAVATRKRKRDKEAAKLAKEEEAAD